MRKEAAEVEVDGRSKTPMIERRKVDVARSRPTFGGGVLLAACIQHVIVAVICSGAGRQIPKSVETRGKRRTVGGVGSRAVRRRGVLLALRTLRVVVVAVARKPRARKRPTLRELFENANGRPSVDRARSRSSSREDGLWTSYVRRIRFCCSCVRVSGAREIKNRTSGEDANENVENATASDRVLDAAETVVWSHRCAPSSSRRSGVSCEGAEAEIETRSTKPNENVGKATSSDRILDAAGVFIGCLECGASWSGHPGASRDGAGGQNRASAENTNEIAQTLTSPDHIPAAPKTSVWCCTCSTLRLRRFASANSARRRPKSKSARKCNEIDEKSTSPERVPKASETFFECGSYDASSLRRSQAQYGDARGKIARWSKIQRKTSKSRCRRIGFQRPRGRPLGLVHVARRWRCGWVRIEARGKTSTARGATVIKTANPDGVERVRDAHNRRRCAGEAICGGRGRPGAAVRRARSEFHPEKRSRRRSFDRRAAKTREHRERTVLVRSEGCAKL